MRLNINSPAYYSKKVGIDNHIYYMCQEISKFMKDKNYSSIVNTVGIVPIIAPKEQIDKGKWKEECKYDLKFGFVFVSKQIDYEKYIKADIKEKKEMILKNIIDSINCIHKKSKFDFVNFKTDLMNFIESQKLIY